MTRLTSTRAPADAANAADPAKAATAIAPRSPAATRRRSLTGVLADPRVRLGAGAAALLVTAAMAVHRDHVSPGEDLVFRAVNGLSDSLYPPAWAVMQLGTLGAAPAAAGVAWLADDGELAGAAPGRRRRHLGALEAGQADGAPAAARHPASGHPPPRP